MGVTTAVHPSDQTLSAYGLGKLDDVSAESVSKHLESCPDCRRRVAVLSSDEFLGRLQNAQVKPDKSAAGWSPSGVSSTEGARGPVVPPASVDTLPPELVDHPDYEIIRELGRGGMGVVYLAQNKLMGRLEVLKVVGGHLIERPGVRDRFLREVQSAAKLQHKNIVAAYAAMRLGESIVLAMEYINGEDLAKMVKSRGSLPVIHACYFIHQAALGLQHAHERGMVHRDIKPANLIFATEGKKGIVKVLDFGLAKVTSEGQTNSALTREGQMLGTPDYIAPEQIRDAQSADIRADIYSLGCTLYYLLTGGPPFRGEHLWDVYQAHFSMEAGPLNLARPEVPVELAAVVAKMMAKEPRRRFQTPGDVAQALAPFFKTGSVGTRVRNVEPSQVRQPAGKPESAAKGSVPTQPATNPTPAAASPVKKSGATAHPEPNWESLIEVKETVSAKEPVPDAAVLKRRIPRWLLPAVAAGVLLVGLAVAWGVILRVKTANGTIELIDLPKDAEVLVDGAEVAVTWLGGGKPAVITVTPGKHKIMVKKDGLEISGEEVSVHTESKEQFTVRFVAPAKPAHEVPNDDGRKSIKNSIGMTLNLILAGEFMMGMPTDAIRGLREPNNAPWFDQQFRAAPKHRVTLTKPWLMGVTEVTIGQFRKFVDATGYATEAEQYGFGNSEATKLDAKITADTKDKTWRTPGYSVTDDSPVTQVTWNDAVSFCNWLSEQEMVKPCYQGDAKVGWSLLATGEGYRLPTEAEWEFSCQAGSTDEPTSEDGFAWLKEHAWFNGNHLAGAQSVAVKPPNRFGLFDMRGNVFEWCHDWYDHDYYFKSAPKDPPGPPSGETRVQRGGGWNYSPLDCHSGLRTSAPPSFRKDNLGFRVVRATTKTPSTVGGALEKPAGSTASPVPSNGFVALFNGKNLNGWAGDVDEYEVRNGLLTWKAGKNQAAIYEPVERRDFVARVEFRLAPGAEGGMEIRYPGYGNGAFTGMCEIRILDDSHPSYANVDDRQFNGSAYGIVPATRGHLKPLGEWNVQEVKMQGSAVKVELNGVVILNADLAPIREFAHGIAHPGKDRTSGFFGLQCGPGTNQGNVEFRKVEIRDLPRSGSASPTEAKPATPLATGSEFQPLFNGKDLTGWAIDSGPRNSWGVEDGNLVVAGPGDWKRSGFVLSNREVSNFNLRFEFQPSPASNSGVTFRATPGEFVGRLAHPLQIELFDRDYPNIKNGSFIWSTSIRPSDILPPDQPVEILPNGSWNRAEIEVKGDSLRATVNGNRILTADLKSLADRPDANPALKRRAGRIGFQSHTGTVRFRNIELKELPPAADSLRPGSVVVTSDLLRKGTIWSGNLEDRYIGGDVKTHRLTFTITQRNGKQFKAMFTLGETQLREVSGTVENGKIQWFAKDTKAIKGFAGFDCNGIVENNHMMFSYSGTNPYNKQKLAGTAHLILESR